MNTLAYPSLGLASLKADFDRQGYCIVRALFAPDEVDEIKNRFITLHAEGPVENHFSPVPEAEAQGDPLKTHPRYMQPHRIDPVSRRYLLHPGVMTVLTALFEADPLAVQSMYYFKPPGSRGQALHQDQFYLLVEPGTCIAAWTAIDAADADNGGMYIVPETQEAEVVCPEAADLSESFINHSVPIPKGKRAIEAKMQPGDTLFFNGRTIHGSGPNRSRDRWRRSFICHYVSEQTEKMSHFYFPILNRHGEVVERQKNQDGGPCGTEWAGATH